jgi:hypothetical protein
MDREIATRMVGRKNKDQLQKIGMCMIKYKDKRQWIVLRKSESDAELNVDG